MSLNKHLISIFTEITPAFAKTLRNRCWKIGVFKYQNELYLNPIRVIVRFHKSIVFNRFQIDE